jgi:hypothetical protein
MKIMLMDQRGTKNRVRLAFAQHLFEAGTVGSDPKSKPSFSCTAILSPDHPVVAQLKAAEEQVAKEKWGAKADTVLKEIRSKDKGVVHDGDSKASYAGFEGNMFVSTRSDTRPSVFDRNPRVNLVAADGKIYSGCYANVQIEVWAQDNSYGKRINAQLLGVQFSEDGDSFGGGAQPAAADDFPDLAVEEDADSLV